MDEQIHDFLHKIAIAREKKEKHQEDEDMLITQLLIYLEQKERGK